MIGFSSLLPRLICTGSEGGISGTIASHSLCMGTQSSFAMVSTTASTKLCREERMESLLKCSAMSPVGVLYVSERHVKGLISLKMLL